jgi:hypothetical protein
MAMPTGLLPSTEEGFLVLSSPSITVPLPSTEGDIKTETVWSLDPRL